MLTYIISKAVCIVAGFIYPAYSSYKVIKAKDEKGLKQWLQYFTILSLFSVAEWFGDTLVFWLPFYYEAKAGFVLWLVMPQTKVRYFASLFYLFIFF